jgi:hypothetical protein
MKQLMINLLRTLLVIIVSAGLCSTLVAAQEFRTLNAIPTPGKTPAGMLPAEEIRPIAPAAAADSVKKVMNAWNGGGIQQHLGDDFYDKSGLADAINIKVPKDAAIRIMSVQGIQTLQQFQRKKDGGGQETISEVSVTADTQVEYNDPTKGFVKFGGVNEYIIRIKEETVR